MSLYGTGRREGIAAVLLLGVLALLVRAIAAWLGDTHDPLAALHPAALPALGGMLCYRCLRAQGRSRYAGFLAGLAYALSPWLLAIGARPNEQFAAALAPLALEAAWQCGRPAARAQWLRWSWLCLAAPWLAGPSAVAAFATTLAVGQILRCVATRDLDGERLPLRAALPPFALSAAAIALALALPVAADWPPTGALPMAPELVLAMHRLEVPGLDLAAVLRVPGAALLALAGLGALRRQRHVNAAAWTGLALLGLLPAALVAVADAMAIDEGLFASLCAVDPWWLASVWWLWLFAVTTLGAAGLDDFLEAPQRRGDAMHWLLAIAILVAPLLPGLGANEPRREWLLAGSLLALPLLLPTWRALGMLRFKNLLATAALLAMAAPALQVRMPHAMPPAAPAGEVRGAADVGADEAAAVRWRYLAASVWLALGAVAVAWSMSTRSFHAHSRPAAAKAAITKKARPAHRS
jgi:hypothetical protein